MVTTVHEGPWPQNAECFQGLLNRHEPTVFRGVANSWLPSTSGADSTLAWLTSIIGHRRVPVTVVLPDEQGLIGIGRIKGHDRINSSTTGHRSFGSAARAMRASLSAAGGSALYIQSVAVAKELPELLPFIKLPLDHLPPGTGEWRTWIGTGNHHVALHWDGRENFYCVLAGQKRFHVCPYDALPDTYVGPMEGNEHGAPSSVVDPKHSDLARYPRFARVLERLAAVDLEVGDVFYLPSHYWHWVESVGFNFSVNYWLNDVPADVVRNAGATFYRALLSMRRLPEHWRRYWKTTFDHFVFGVNGDPYSHLPLDEQGFAGTATPEALDHIRAAIYASEVEHEAREKSDEFILQTKYKLCPTLAMRFGSNSTIFMREASSRREQGVPAGFLAVLAHFVSPHTPTEVVAHLQSTGVNVDQGLIVSPIRELVAARILSPAE